MGSETDRGIVWIGLGVLASGMVMFGLGVYFVDSYSISHPGSLLLLFGGFVTIFGLMTLGAGGGLRIIGVFSLVVGTIGFLFGLVASILDIPTYYSFALGLGRYYGLWVGPVFMVIGLGSLLAAGWGKRAAISA